MHRCIGYASRSNTHTVGAKHIPAKKTLHLMRRSLLSGSNLGGNAIGGDDDLVATHVGISGGHDRR